MTAVAGNIFFVLFHVSLDTSCAASLKKLMADPKLTWKSMLSEGFGDVCASGKLPVIQM